MSLEGKCVLCERSDIKILFEKTVYLYSREYVGEIAENLPIKITLVKCKRCGLVSLIPPFSQTELTERYEFYGKRNLECMKAASSSAELPTPPEKYAEYLEYIESYRKYNRLLDVGCGAGEFLHWAKKKGWFVEGTELSRSYALYAKNKYNINVFIGSLGEAKYPKNYFDVVTMWEVVEHLPTPVEYIKGAYSVLRPHGLIAISTPNFSSVARRLLGKYWSPIICEHLYYFTPDTLSKMLAKVGFKVVKILTKMFDIGFAIGVIKRKVSSPNIECLDRVDRRALPSYTGNDSSFKEICKGGRYLYKPFLSLISHFRGGEELIILAEKNTTGKKASMRFST